MPSRMPQAFDRVTTFRFHLSLLGALAPMVVMAALVQGPWILVNIALGVGTSWAADELLRRLRRVVEPQDLAAPLWGLLLALLLPVQAPFYLPVLGSLFSVLVVKGLLGGGATPWVNPVLAAWAFLQTGWASEFPAKAAALGGNRTAFDQQATDWLNNNLFSWFSIQLPGGYLDLFVGLAHPSTALVAESGTLVLLLATVYLLAKGFLPWEVPAFFFLGFAVPLALVGGDVLLQVFSGSFLICLFFLASDSSSRPLSRLGLILYGLGAGLMAFLVRTWGTGGDGVGYAVLVMNLVVPWLDRRLKRKSLNDFRLA